MQQTPTKSAGAAKNSNHMSKRPPRNILTSEPPVPHQHATQRAHEDEITDWVSMEGGETDPLMVPDAIKRPNYVCRWIAKSVLGAEDALIKRKFTEAYRAGWRPIPGERGKGFFFLPNETVPATIEVGGQVLCERPQHIEDHARMLNRRAADAQLRNKLVEVGMAAPQNVRDKLVNHKVDPTPDIIQSVPASDKMAVPE